MIQQLTLVSIQRVLVVHKSLGSILVEFEDVDRQIEVLSGSHWPVVRGYGEILPSSPSLSQQKTNDLP